MSNNASNQFPRPRPSATGSTANVECPRQGRAAEQVQADEELPRRGKPFCEASDPPWRPHYPDNDDLPSRLPGSDPSHPAAGAIDKEAEPDPEPEDPWDFGENKRRLVNLLRDEWPKWGKAHHVEFMNAFCDTVEELVGEWKPASSAAKSTGQP